MKRLIVILLISLTTLPAVASDGKKNILVKFRDWREQSMLANVDTSYIGLPKYSWQAGIDNTLYSSNTSTIHFGDNISQGAIKNVTYDLKTGVSDKISGSLHFRGLGLGYGFNLKDRDETRFSIGLNGNTFGLNLKINNYEQTTGKYRITFEDGTVEQGEIQPNDVVVSNLSVSGYYVFNHRTFAYNASTSRSLIQKKSAGSAVIAAEYFLASLMPNIGEGIVYFPITDYQGQIRISGGYAYNLVFADRHLLLHAKLLVSPLSYTYYYVYRDNKEIKEYTARELGFHLSLSGSLGLHYNINDRFFTGIYADNDFTTVSHHHVATYKGYDLQAHVYFGVRF